MIKNFKNFEKKYFFYKNHDKIYHEKIDFCRIFFKNSNSAVSAEYENGVFVHFLYIWMITFKYLMFPQNTHLIDTRPNLPGETTRW